MDCDEVMGELESLGTEQNRRIYRRHGAGENQFGVSFANLRRLARQIKRDQPLAEQLWATGNQDARSLATLIADGKSMSVEGLDRWAHSIDYYAIGEMFAGNVAAVNAEAADLAQRWTAEDNNFVEQTGWNLIAVLAMRDRRLSDAWFDAYLQRIEYEIGGAKNRVRHTMNGALIAIGVRNARLRARAEAVARGIGRIEVDHGETGCVTPEAVPYIARTWVRRSAAEAKSGSSRTPARRPSPRPAGP